ncbi:MAG: PEP-CTERM sorting domain-containing protein [Okeania sp. SIO3C4]|nr:PEP-CTERM sorting domain-containing protein [Okeania sp. SIO3C4]
MQLPKMQLRQQYSLGFFATTLLVVLTSQSSFAFTITPAQPGASMTFDPSEEYTLPDGRKGITTLDPLSVTEITRGGTAGFLAQLRAEFPATAGWNFTAAAADLAGSFNIDIYDAQGTPGRVGAEFQLQYNPGAGDPTSAGNDLHWIQRVVNNHNITTNPGHGNPENVIDIPLGQTNPFYDQIPGIIGTDEDTLYDFPGRTDADENHFWFAELYLVEETAPMTVTIYNGVRWGWRNTIPEPSSVLGLFVIGVLGSVSALKRKQKQHKLLENETSKTV